MDIHSEIGKINKTNNALSNLDQVSEDLNNYKFTPFPIHYYMLGNHTISFIFETRLFEHYLHPLIGHFETTEASGDIPLFELFSWQEQIVFRFNGRINGIWTKDETHLVKGLIFMFLINVMHNKTDADWLMTVHASAPSRMGRKPSCFRQIPAKGKPQ